MLVGSSFTKKANLNARRLRRFITKVEKNTPTKLDQKVEVMAKQVWEGVDCLSCGNCCKRMTPTFNKTDLLRISKYFGMTVDAFKEKYLVYDKSNGDWQNKKQPCQFLNPKDNKCSIYEIRPADCAGFPHLTKKKWVDYAHVHKQNIVYCPATYSLITKMEENLYK